ncbi:Dps family protein [Candidatus Deianiraea vastatrix]|uniref:DNA protection during starvation protein n=1 Tax=Candidatus Deianiraea vastatrix TaxID=2163644 RepID=A0A5B8XFC4_9RICK|nr:DNA starvation/stationary phase protection protein [Candidatus Deianiraea vastatrix]QED23676.1 Putative DNA protection during starvation protein [Candidatus Deianiraea vastatrix]
MPKLLNILILTHNLALKTQNFHWNVQGSNFYSLHKMFEEQYEEISNSIDEIAERIRILGDKVPSISQNLEINPNLLPSDMLKNLALDHENIILQIEDVKKSSDDVTVDMLNERLAAHQKHLWFLRSSFA